MGDHKMVEPHIEKNVQTESIRMDVGEGMLLEGVRNCLQEARQAKVDIHLVPAGLEHNQDT